MLKGLQKQATAHQQYDRERRLNDNQRMLEPVAAAAGCPAAALTKSLLQRDSRSAQCRRESEDQRRCDCSGGGEYEHPPIEREPRGAHGRRYKSLEKSHGRHCERETGKCTQGGEHEALGKELADQPAPGRSKSGAHDDFLAARGAARKQEIREIDACDQQQRQRGAQQQDQRILCSARDLFPQRRDDNRVGTRELLRGQLKTQGRHGPLNPFSGCGVAFASRRVGLAQCVPDHYETVRIGVREWAYQHRVDGAEHRRNPADTESERRDRDSRERRIASELPQSIADVSPGHLEPCATASTSNAFLGLFQASQLERGSTAGFVNGCTVADLVGGSHVNEGFYLFVQLALGLIPPDHPSHDRSETMQERHAPSRTLATANETRFQRARCCSSCRRPEAVRR